MNPRRCPPTRAEGSSQCPQRGTANYFDDGGGHARHFVLVSLKKYYVWFRRVTGASGISQPSRVRNACLQSDDQVAKGSGRFVSFSVVRAGWCGDNSRLACSRPSRFLGLWRSRDDGGGLQVGVSVRRGATTARFRLAANKFSHARWQAPFFPANSNQDPLSRRRSRELCCPVQYLPVISQRHFCFWQSRGNAPQRQSHVVTVITSRILVRGESSIFYAFPTRASNA